MSYDPPEDFTGAVTVHSRHYCSDITDSQKLLMCLKWDNQTTNNTPCSEIKHMWTLVPENVAGSRWPNDFTRGLLASELFIWLLFMVWCTKTPTRCRLAPIKIKQHTTVPKLNCTQLCRNHCKMFSHHHFIDDQTKTQISLFFNIGSTCRAHDECHGVAYRLALQRLWSDSLRWDANCNGSSIRCVSVLDEDRIHHIHLRQCS